MRKKIVFVFLIAFLFITGCSCSKIVKEISENEKYKKIVKEEAIKYFKNKYGIELVDNNIKNVGLLSDGNEWSSSYSNYGNANVEYNNKSFKINVNYKTRNSDEYYDNYEQDIIVKSIRDYYFNALDLDERYSVMYFPNYIAFYHHTHDKFSELNSFINSIDYNGYETHLIIFTTQEFDKEKVKEVADDFNNIDLTIYRLYNEVNIHKFNNIFYTNYYHSHEDDMYFTNVDEFFVEEKYSCRDNNGCISYIDREVISLGNNFYTSKNANIEISKINDQNKINSYLDQIKSCGENLRILDAYSVKNKGDNSLTIHNANPSNGSTFQSYSKYPIIIDGGVNCSNYNKNTIDFMKYDGSTIILVENN